MSSPVATLETQGYGKAETRSMSVSGWRLEVGGRSVVALAAVGRRRRALVHRVKRVIRVKLQIPHSSKAACRGGSQWQSWEVWCGHIVASRGAGRLYCPLGARLALETPQAPPVTKSSGYYLRMREVDTRLQAKLRGSPLTRATRIGQTRGHLQQLHPRQCNPGGDKV